MMMSFEFYMNPTCFYSKETGELFFPQVSVLML